MLVGGGCEKWSLGKTGLCKSILPNRTTAFESTFLGSSFILLVIQYSEEVGVLQKSSGRGLGIIISQRELCVWFYFLGIDFASVVDAVVRCPDPQMPCILDRDGSRLSSSLGTTHRLRQPPHPSSHPPLWVQLASNDCSMERDIKAWAPCLKAGQLWRSVKALNLPNPRPFQLLPLSILLLPFLQRGWEHPPINYLHENLHLRVCFLENPTKTTGEEKNQQYKWWQWERMGSSRF